MAPRATYPHMAPCATLQPIAPCATCSPVAPCAIYPHMAPCAAFQPVAPCATYTPVAPCATYPHMAPCATYPLMAPCATTPPMAPCATHMPSTPLPIPKPPTSCSLHMPTVSAMAAPQATGDRCTRDDRDDRSEAGDSGAGREQELREQLLRRAGSGLLAGGGLPTDGALRRIVLPEPPSVATVATQTQAGGPSPAAAPVGGAAAAPPKQARCHSCGQHFALVNYNGPEPTCFPCRKVGGGRAKAQGRACGVQTDAAGAPAHAIARTHSAAGTVTARRGSTDTTAPVLAPSVALLSQLPLTRPRTATPAAPPSAAAPCTPTPPARPVWASAAASMTAETTPQGSSAAAAAAAINAGCGRAAAKAAGRAAGAAVACGGDASAAAAAGAAAAAAMRPDTAPSAGSNASHPAPPPSAMVDCVSCGELTPAPCGVPRERVRVLCTQCQSDRVAGWAGLDVFGADTAAQLGTVESGTGLGAGCTCCADGKRDFCICSARGVAARPQGRGSGCGLSMGQGRSTAKGAERRPYRCSLCGEPKKGHICSAGAQRETPIELSDEEQGATAQPRAIAERLQARRQSSGK